MKCQIIYAHYHRCVDSHPQFHTETRGLILLLCAENVCLKIVFFAESRTDIEGASVLHHELQSPWVCISADFCSGML